MCPFLSSCQLLLELNLNEVEMTLATWPLVYLDPSSFKVRTGFHLGSQAGERDVLVKIVQTNSHTTVGLQSHR